MNPEQISQDFTLSQHEWGARGHLATGKPCALQEEQWTALPLTDSGRLDDG